MSLADLAALPWLPWLLSGAAGGLVLGLLVGLLAGGQATARARQENAVLAARLEATEAMEQERDRAFDEARYQLSNAFQALAGEALRDNAESFLRLAQERLGQFQVQARADLGERERAVERLVAPLREALGRTETQIQALEKERREAYGALQAHLQGMAGVQRELQAETANLVRALRRPEVRGRWGEMTLRRLVELAGMVEHCDFEEQAHRGTDQGPVRPDLVVRLPNAREIVVDAKTPLDAYMDATEATGDDARREALIRHARGLRRQVQSLADKAYWRQFQRAPDFVVLFIPGEQFLSAALDQDRDLLEYALARQVIPATPTTLVALLRSVAFGWRQEALAAHTEQVRELGVTLHQRLVTFAEHLSRLGRSLGSSVDHYNRALGSLERQVLSAARRFADYGVDSDRPLDAPPPLERTVRPPAHAGESPGDTEPGHDT